MKRTGKGAVGVLVLWMGLTLLVAFSSEEGEAIPEKISYQGYLTNAAGVPVNGSVTMVFAIYDALSGGTKLWEELHNVNVTTGVYNVTLGEGTPPNPINLLFNMPYYLGVKAGGDPEMTPRILLTSVGYAFRAKSVDSVGSHTHDGGDITAGIVAEARIDGAIARDSEVMAIVKANDGSGSGLDADLLDGFHETSFFRLDQSEVVTGLPSFNGGTSGSTAPFNVDSTYLVTNLNADLLDGKHGIDFASNSHNHAGVYVNSAGDTMTGTLKLPANGLVAGTNQLALSGGKVGIGTASPTELFEVKSSSSNAYVVMDRGTDKHGGIVHRENGTSRWIFPMFRGWQSDNLIVRDEASSIDVMTYRTGTGNVGIGTDPNDANSISEKLTVEGGNLLLKNTAAGKSMRFRTTADALDFDLSGHSLYVNGDGGYIMLVHNSRKNIGIGTDDPNQDYRLHVVGPRTQYSIAGYFSNGWGGTTASAQLAKTDVGVEGQGDNQGVRGVCTGPTGWDFYAAGRGNYGAFTGGHEVKLANDFPVEVKPGMILSVTGETKSRKLPDGTVSLSSNLPTAMLSKREKDKAVFGVLIQETPLPPKHWYSAKEGERFATVNALGEGKVWVSNINGNIEAGDFITTSSIPGYGQKQDDDILRNYTLGKSIETVDWDGVTETVEYNGQRFKVYLIGVVYTSG